MIPRKTYHRKVFDFEIGCLIKSPCRSCLERYRLPVCADGCSIIDQIQSVLARGVSSSRSHSDSESYTIQIDA